MTTMELRYYMNHTFGMDNRWPETIKTDKDTFKNVLLEVFLHPSTDVGFPLFVKIQTGKHGGVMYKGVELILNKE